MEGIPIFIATYIKHKLLPHMTQSLPPKGLVLYADDDADDIELMEEVFKEYAGILDFVAFKNGQQLLHYLERLDPFQPQPCLIILDINMPVLDGKQTLKRLRAMKGYTEVPVVLFTTSTLPHEAAFAQHYQAGFITKPLTTVHMHVILDQMLEYCTDDFKKRINQYRGK